jgi:hypothetical protein
MKQCPKCLSKYKSDGRKLSVPYLVDQPTASLDYRGLWCPSCKKFVEYYKVGK